MEVFASRYCIILIALLANRSTSVSQNLILSVRRLTVGNSGHHQDWTVLQTFVKGVPSKPHRRHIQKCRKTQNRHF